MIKNGIGFFNGSLRIAADAEIPKEDPATPSGQLANRFCILRDKNERRIPKRRFPRGLI
jgi:hypothetical protein